MMHLLIFMVGVAWASWLFTRLFRFVALRSNWFDTPNQRSSHVTPVPSGAGLGFMAACLLTWWFMAPFNPLGADSAITIIAASAVLGLLGFVDDRIELGARVRFFAQLLASIIVIAQLGGFAPLSLFDVVIHPKHVLALMFAALWLLWMTNLTNFMDGINGLAAAQILFVSAVFGGFYWQLGSFGLAAFWWVISAAMIGFLPLNFPHARVFMGDAGSVFLGFLVAGMAIWMGWQNPDFFWLTVILMSTFITDSTMTLLRRLIKRERLSQAHRSHIYQRLAQALGSHAKVVGLYSMINVVWVLPVAYGVFKGYFSSPLVAMMACYLPLLGIWLALHQRLKLD